MNRSLPILVSLPVLLALTPTAAAQLAVNREVSFVAGDVVAGDAFGTALDASGVRAIVGAPMHDTGGLADAGAAYVFRREATGWIEEAKLVASDAGLDAEFGRAVAIDGDTAAVGAPGVGGGAVYVFVRSGTSWTQQAKLLPGDVLTGDELGAAVALEGDTLLAGAPGDDAGGNGAGSVHVFVRSGTSWTRTQELLAPIAGAAERFGAALGFQGNLAGVGAPNGGRVFAFERVAGTWDAGLQVVQKSTVTGQLLGSSIDVSGETILAGQPVRANGVARWGSVFVLRRSGSVWLIRALLPSGTIENDRLGTDVAFGTGRFFAGSPGRAAWQQGTIYAFDVEALPAGTGYEETLRTASRDAAAADAFGESLVWAGDELLVGAPGAASGAGVVKALLLRDALTTTGQTQRLDLTGPGHDLGRSVALTGDTLVVGAPELIDPSVGFGPGSVRVYERDASGQWGAPTVVAPSGLAFGDGFGGSVAAEGDRFVTTGADTAGLGAGASYVYRRQGTGWTLEAKLTPPDLAPDDGAASVALSGNTLAVAAIGDDGPTGTWHGSVNVWVRSGTSWSHQARLQPQTSGGDLFFGLSVALDGDTLLVGSEQAWAYVYRRTGTSWAEETQLGAGIEGRTSGVDVQGDTAVVGTYVVEDLADNVVQIFEREASGWVHAASARPPRPRTFGFGGLVALDGDRLLVGARFDANAPLGREDATLFRRRDGDWIPVQSLVAEPSGFFALGSAVDLEGDTAVLGAPDLWLGGPNVPGSVYVYDLDATFESFCDASDGSLAACPCGNPGADDAGCGIAGGGSVKLEVFGQQFESGNRATLTASGFPLGATPATVLLRSASLEPIPVAFGDGLRCLATPLVWVRAAFAIGGSATHEIEHDAPSGTFHYQVWFRNGPASFCDGAAAFNLSNGRTLEW